jgi:hypothetical protein
MKRTSQSRAKDLPSQLFASNPAMLIGAAFEIGMLLGRRSGRTAMGRKLRDNVTSVTDQAVRLAPDALVKLVPALAPAKPPRPSRPRRRTAKK